MKTKKTLLDSAHEQNRSTIIDYLTVAFARVLGLDVFIALVASLVYRPLLDNKLFILVVVGTMGFCGYGLTSILVYYRIGRHTKWFVLPCWIGIHLLILLMALDSALLAMGVIDDHLF